MGGGIEEALGEQPLNGSPVIAQILGFQDPLPAFFSSGEQAAQIVPQLLQPGQGEMLTQAPGQEA